VCLCDAQVWLAEGSHEYAQLAREQLQVQMPFVLAKAPAHLQGRAQAAHARAVLATVPAGELRGGGGGMQVLWALREATAAFARMDDVGREVAVRARARAHARAHTRTPACLLVSVTAQWLNSYQGIPRKRNLSSSPNGKGMICRHSLRGARRRTS
jgi:hypothetical protein